MGLSILFLFFDFFFSKHIFDEFGFCIPKFLIIFLFSLRFFLSPPSTLLSLLNFSLDLLKPVLFLVYDLSASQNFLLPILAHSLDFFNFLKFVKK